MVSGVSGRTAVEATRAAEILFKTVHRFIKDRRVAVHVAPDDLDVSHVPHSSRAAILMALHRCFDVLHHDRLACSASAEGHPVGPHPYYAKPSWPVKPYVGIPISSPRSVLVYGTHKLDRKPQRGQAP